MTRLSRSIPLASLAAAILLTACQAATVDGASPGGAAQTVAVQVDPGSAQVAPGGSAQFDAAVTGTADVAVVWSVIEVGGGTIDATGLYTAPGAAGSYHVTVTAHADPAVSATAVVTVTPAPAVSVAISPASTTVAATGTVVFTATVSNAANTAVTWRVQEASGCGSVSSAGIYTAPAAAATCHVAATSVQDGTKTATATVTVSAPPAPVSVAISPASTTVTAGGTATFAATVSNATNTAVTWRVQEASGCGSVTAAGVYTAPAAAATCHVVATSVQDGTKTATATVTVSALPVPVSVAISPASTTVAASGTTAFTATVSNATNTAVTWRVQEASGCGSVTAAGVYTAPAAAATCHVVATSVQDGTKTATATVTVSAPPTPVSVAISPASTTAAAGGTATFTATVSNAANTAVTWRVQEASGCGSVTAAGVYTAPAAAGTCHVVATSVQDGTKTATATVTVSAPPTPVSVAISPASTTVAASGTTAFTATVSNATNTAVTWRVQEASGCGSVTAAGVYTAPAAAATCHVVATSVQDGTKTATATVTVSAPPTPVSVAISPASTTVAASGTATFAATVSNATNTAVTWRVQEASGCGSVTAAGVYTAPAAAATCHVVATSVQDGTKTATATVTVSAPPTPVSVAISPASTTVAASGTATFAATVSNATNTAVTWRVQEASGCGSVTAAGVYTAPAAAATCHVVATSVQDGTKTATATVTVSAPPTPVSVAITPGSAAVSACSNATFTASVTGSADQAVAWSVVEATGGTITSAGLYTAPSTAGTYHVVATSHASAATTATATVTVSDRVLSVVVSPSTLSLAPGATGQFTATVTTTCGSFASVQSVTAPL